MRKLIAFLIVIILLTTFAQARIYSRNVREQMGECIKTDNTVFRPTSKSVLYQFDEDQTGKRTAIREVPYKKSNERIRKSFVSKHHSLVKCRDVDINKKLNYPKKYNHVYVSQRNPYLCKIGKK
jgi:hypothetical protein